MTNRTHGTTGPSRISTMLRPPWIHSCRNDSLAQDLHSTRPVDPVPLGPGPVVHGLHGPAMVVLLVVTHPGQKPDPEVQRLSRCKCLILDTWNK